MRCTLLLTQLAIVVACGPTLLRSPSADGKRQTGLLRFEYTRIRSLDSERRRDAERRMSESCGGAYRIVDERARTEMTVVHRRRRGSGTDQPRVYWYIEYTCDTGNAPVAR
jgi:hypothetical protein